MFRSKLSYWFLAAGCMVASGVFSTAKAGVFQSTLNPVGTTSNQVTIPRNNGSSPTILYEEFKAGAGAQAKLDDLEFEVQSTGTTGSVVITLWTDSPSPNPGTPTTQIATLTSIPILSLTNGLGSGVQGLVDISGLLANPVTQHLSNNAEYWIGFQQIGVNGGQVSATQLELTTTIAMGTTVGFPTSALLSPTNGPAYIQDCTSSDTTSCELLAASFGLPEMTVQAPEPATLAVLGSALTGLGLIRRRRAKKTA
jgi:hypothetical protein